MKQSEYKLIRKKLFDMAETIMNDKQPEYTNNNADILNNFKTTAEALKITPIEVWAVFFHKHTQSIMTHAQNSKTKMSEPIESRYADLINYLTLGLAIIQDGK